MLQAIKIRLYPNAEQVDYINNLLGCSRFVYNYCLSAKIEAFNKDKSTLSFGKLGKLITDLKKNEEYLWLSNAHSKVLQQSIINLNYAYNNFFKNGQGFPNFKSKKHVQSCRFPKDAIGNIKGNRINIIKPLSNIHFKCSTRDEKFLNYNQDIIKSATLTKTKSGNYLLSILVDRIIEKQLPQTNKVVGIDLGIKSFIITSDSEYFDNIKSTRNNETKLKKLHKNLSKKQKGSKNKEKARLKLAKCHEKLNNKKENYLHDISNKLLNENQVIVMEDLNVKGMMQNKHLSKSIQELSLFRFKEILKYKSEWYDRDIIEIDRFYPSSKKCNCCGYINKNLKLSDRTYDCPSCGSSVDRDLNAALNIRDEGLKILKIGLSSPEFKPVEIYSIEESKKQESKCKY